jgi:hypothetical protein
MHKYNVCGHMTQGGNATTIDNIHLPENFLP